MPTYEYKCDDCGHQFDVYQSMKDEKLTTCPNCGKNTLKRLIGTGGGLIFKGSGFYLTDYKNKPAETSSGTSAKSTQDSTSKDKTSSAETSKSNSKSDSKEPTPAAKTETKPSKEKSNNS